ncbi:MAG: ATP-binding cassette domain-containing protein [Acidobacteria bacterium]|nr:ATP-binding cassette domain-containing protein [Acidobacteriota bacterium]
MPLIEVSNLVKVYPGGIRAVDDITFTVDRGEVFGFLGPNGAGKTTTIRILVTLLAPTSGTAVVDGIDVTVAPEEVRKRVGYAAQFIGVDDDLTARENLVLQGRLHGLSKTEARRRGDDLLEILQLTAAADRRAGTFSGGMKRRLDLGQALSHDPELLFLDEPTIGLDPPTRRALWVYLRELNARGVTIFLTTQYLEEADALAGRLAIIDEGVIVIEGTPQALKDDLGGDAITVTLAPGDGSQVERVAELIGQYSDAGAARTYDGAVRVFTRDAASRLADVVRTLDSAGIHVARLEVSEPTLDDVFLRHTGGKMRVEEVKPRSRMMFTRKPR